MPKITVLPHAVLCPEGAVIEDAPEGKTVLDVLLDHDIEVDHACGLEADSRLSCQAVVADEDLVVEIPKYTINHAREEH